MPQRKLDSFNPEPKQIVFGLFKQSLAGHGTVRKFNFTFLYMTYCITPVQIS